MTVGAVIVGAGASTRAGVDKVFADLAGEPVVAYSLRAFEASPSVDRVVLVLAERNLEQGRELVRRGGWRKVARVCQGGARRQDSVAAGLRQLRDCDWVVIHDAARPLITPELIERGIAEAGVTGGAIAAVPVTDTIKVVGPDFVILDTPARAALWAVQTPQVFGYRLIVAAYESAQAEVTDDAMLLEQQGHPVRVYPSSPDNIKITLPQDLLLAAVLLERRRCQGSA
ncbi:MAG: 2-C-methyl-D-erythritol 4-phosphate cytidylyltransferase [Dehalococcoidales bacterium]|nr:2-C-methyl-D-erythritol 4-phosphate cytidylyltransferase [Dehalococcoidales bacterium]